MLCNLDPFNLTQSNKVVLNLSELAFYIVVIYCVPTPMSQSESAGVVKISDDGVVVIPVEVREVLGIKNKAAFVRINDIEVAKVIDGDEDDGGDA